MNPCPVCREPLEVGWDACPACGTPVCTSCQRALKPHWRHCPHCKTPTHMTPSGSAVVGASPLPGAPGSPATGQPAPFTELGATPTVGALPDVPNGTQLADRYRVEAKLGVGGHGTVYRAFDTLLHDRPLALKLLTVTHPAAFAGIVREYHARKRIRSFEHVLMADQPMVARYLDHEIILYPMDLADGGNLRDQIPTLNAIEDPTNRQEAILDLFRQMCQGVHACHEAGIAHLDLKPENFLLHEGRLKVSDFGIARVLGAPSDARDGIGTGPYMAPEQHLAANPDDVDHRADIYALGVILYELLGGGKRPYEGGDLHRKKRELRPKRLEVPAALQNLLDKTIASDPDERHRTALGLIGDLQPAVTRTAPAENVVAARPTFARTEITTCRRTLTGHTDTVWSVAFSSDDTTLASASSDKTSRLWNPHTGTHQRTLTGHMGIFRAVAFSPDGTTLASASYDRTIRLWNPHTGAHQRTLAGHTGWVRAVAFSPDETALASASGDGTIRLWNPQTGRHLRVLTTGIYLLRTIAFSPDGSTLASASGDGTIRLWDPHSGRHQRSLNGHTDSVWTIAFSPDGSTLASAGSDGTIRLWNPHTGRRQRSLNGHIDTVWAVAFSPDGSTLASAGSDGTIRLWNPHTGRRQRTLTGHQGAVYSIAFSSTGSTLASASSDTTVILWGAGSTEVQADGG